MSIAVKYLKAGFRFFFRPDQILSGGTLITNPSSGFVDMGVCTALTPTVTNTIIELKDTRGGSLKVVARGVTEQKEEYKGTFADFNRKNLPLIFGSGPESVNSRAAIDFQSGFSILGTYAGENFGANIQENDTLFLGTSSNPDSTGNIVLDQSFVPVVYAINNTATSSTTLYVADVNYTLDNLNGTIKIIDHPAAVENNIANNLIVVKYKAAAFAATNQTYFVITPQSAGGIVTGRMRMEVGSSGNTERLYRIGRASLNVDSINFTAEDFSKYDMTFAILNDVDAGRLFNML